MEEHKATKGQAQMIVGTHVKIATPLGGYCCGQLTEGPCQVRYGYMVSESMGGICYDILVTLGADVYDQMWNPTGVKTFGKGFCTPHPVSLKKK